MLSYEFHVELAWSLFVISRIPRITSDVPRAANFTAASKPRLVFAPVTIMFLPFKDTSGSAGDTFSAGENRRDVT